VTTLEETSDGWRVYSHEAIEVSTMDGEKPLEWYQSEDGYKYCFTVPTGSFLVRQNGKVFITLNSGKSEVAVIDFLRYTDIPNFIGVISRRTNPQMKGPGGVLAKCRRVFRQAYDSDEFVWRERDGK